MSLVLLTAGLLYIQSQVHAQTCPDSIVHVGGGCYNVQTSRMKWTDAVSHCANNEKQLAKPLTENVNNAIKEHLMTLNPSCLTTSSNRFWLGILRTSETQHFHFDNTTEDLPYTDWNPNNTPPSDTYVDEGSNCVIFNCYNTSGSVVHYWLVSSCSKKYRPVCEMTECPGECIPEVSSSSSSSPSSNSTTVTSTEKMSTVTTTDSSSGNGIGTGTGSDVTTTKLTQSGSPKAVTGMRLVIFATAMTLYPVL